jgi:hypothetical protein
VDLLRLESLIDEIWATDLAKCMAIDEIAKLKEKVDVRDQWRQFGRYHSCTAAVECEDIYLKNAYEI